MSASNYVAAPLSADFIPSKEDRDFSHVFSAVYQLIEAAVDQEGKPQSERLALRLSTCRNAYLTANALYVDLIEVFGHGKKPSLMSSSLVNLQREKFSVSKKALDEISENLSHFEEKMKVWEERFILESILENALNSLNQLTTDEAIAIIQNVRQSSSYGKHRWERKYYELSTDEPSLMKEKLGTLKEVYASTKALLDVGRGIIHIAERITENADLFTGQYDPIGDWNSILEFLSENAGLFWIGVNGEGVARILSWRDANGNVCELRHNTSNISRDQESLISLLKDTEKKTYKRLASAFKANVGEAPLPQPFVVDLSDPSQGKPCVKNGINVERIDFHTSTPQNVKIAVSGFGVPLEYYNRGSFFRFDTESKRNAVFELAIEAIKTAGSEDAAAIVFPEYFLPRDHLEEITRSAQECNLILIGGLEGTQKEEKLLNQASVYFPSINQTYFVPKHRNSCYESNLFYSDTKHHLFERTPIGTFTVIVCSDFREADIVDSIRQSAPELHILIVCACNPYPDLFKSLAIADSSRLCSCIIIANNFINQKDPTVVSGKGSIVCTPFKEPAEMIEESGNETIRLNCSKIAGQEPVLNFFDIDLEGLVQGIRNPKPDPDYIAVPHCRR